MCWRKHLPILKRDCTCGKVPETVAQREAVKQRLESVRREIDALEQKHRVLREGQPPASTTS